eukprot:122555_1
MNIALVMKHYSLGTVSTIDLDHHAFKFFVKNPAGYVWKLLFDMSNILTIMNQKHHWIDRDVKTKNIMLSGNIKQWQTTSFVKIDNGIAMTMKGAKYQLLDFEERQEFCHFGTHSSPLDVRIMYGQKMRINRNDVDDKFQQQYDQLMAAWKLSRNLESNDIIDLVACAAELWDKICEPASKLNFRTWILEHSEEWRREVVDTNWSILNQYYNEEHLKNISIPPQNIRDFLIKMYWLSFHQLPEHDEHNKVKDIFNWHVFTKWLHGINVTYP